MNYCVAFLMSTILGVEQVPLDTALTYQHYAVEPRRFIRKLPSADTMITCITEKYIDTIVNKPELWRK